MKFFIHFLHDFLNLFFPELCGACGKHLLKGEREICIHCLYKLPYTNFHRDPENRLLRQFWGRVELEQASALLYFRKGSRTQNLLHQLKYQRKQELGKRLGQIYGEQLAAWPGFIKPDLIIPVPLHPQKLRLRGYNQSACIAEGLSLALQAPVSIRHLTRRVHTESQTLKSRFSRYENMQDAFELSNEAELENKHILLVDDVITTGSTAEACILCMQEKATLTVSLAALAYAE